jgi:hypothetical protein
MAKPGRDADGLAKTGADHFMKCPGCGEWFDMPDLEEVAKHVHDEDFEISEPVRSRGLDGSPGGAGTFIQRNKLKRI